MRSLPAAARVVEALKRLQKPLDTYSWLQKQLRTRDVSRDPEYQRRFAGFYRVRRGRDWRRVYFQALEMDKDATVFFEDVLRYMWEKTGRMEASFASKLVATIDPEQPVIDSVVLRNVGLRLPATSARDRARRTVEVYRELRRWYEWQLCSNAGRSAVNLFRATYPHAPITETKMLDLILWQCRDA